MRSHIRRRFKRLLRLQCSTVSRLVFVPQVPISPKMKAKMSPSEFRLANVMLGALWSDPDPNVHHGVKPSPRGAGSAFSELAAKTFLKSNNLSMMIRSHEVSSPYHHTR